MCPLFIFNLPCQNNDIIFTFKFTYIYRKEGTKPQLDLETTTGAILSDEDPLSLLFPLGAMKAEPVIGKIVKMSLPPLAERYKEACSQMDTGEFIKFCFIS